MSSKRPAEPTVRDLSADDVHTVPAAFAATGWDKPAAPFLTYLDECRNGSRLALVADLAPLFCFPATGQRAGEFGAPPRSQVGFDTARGATTGLRKQIDFRLRVRGGHGTMPVDGVYVLQQ
jgi:hypothetical protein